LGCNLLAGPQNERIKLCMSTTTILNIEELEKGLPAVSPAMGAAHVEACIVCLSTEQHISGVELSVEGNLSEVYQIRWNKGVTEQMRATWNDPQDATEYAACGLAFLLVLKRTDYTVILRSRKGTGYDYRLGLKDAELPFQNTARLEVSGIQRMCTLTDINTRVKKKLEQTKRSDDLDHGAVYVIVVEFSEPTSRVAVRNE
jgi:hypothetical protein